VVSVGFLQRKGICGGGVEKVRHIPETFVSNL
jgi:hypothetical protein